MSTHFIVEPHPTRKGAWRVVRTGDTRFALSQRFNKRHTAEKHAYELQVAYERRGRAPYLGD